MFVLKPHVAGPEGQITSPDIIVDYLFVNGQKRTLSLLTHECWLQVNAQIASYAGYGIMALGGGALILPALVLENGVVSASRRAWRLNNLDAHIGQVRLNDTSLVDVRLPSEVIASVGGTGDALPRGFLLICTTEEQTTEAILKDPILNRQLEHKLHLEELSNDRWGADRPRPRYSVGPTQKDVPHYI